MTDGDDAYDDLWVDADADDRGRRRVPVIEPDDGFDDDLWVDADADIDVPLRGRSPRPPRRRGSSPEVVERPGSTGSVAVRPSLSSEDLESDRGVIAGPPPGEDADEDDHDRSVEKLPRWVLVLGFIVLFIGLIFGGLTFWYQRQVNPPGPLGAVVEVEVPRGSSASGIGNRLASNGVVRNGLLFNFWASRNSVGGIDAGVYVFNENMSYDEARQVLEDGPARQLEAGGDTVKVLIPEGLTIDKIVDRIDDTVPRFTDEEIHAALESGEVTSTLMPEGGESWEGLLFPATYDVGSKTTAPEFLTTLSREMERRVANFDPDTAVKRLNERYDLDLDVYDVLKVASLVQSEAGGASEAGKISSVIYNRLAKKSTAWTLGIDAADEYGAALEDMTPGEYRETDGAYNLRRIAGLPPTPISAPGDYALKAAFEPEDTEYMWYVLKAEGVHTFVVTEAEFETAKAHCKAAGLGCG